MISFNKRLFSYTLAFALAMPWALASAPCFFVEGATGVGKTTFVQLLGKSLPNAMTLYEPVETFTDVNGAGNILELFFSDPKRWTYLTETYIPLMRIKAVEEHMKNASASVAIIDRSMQADCYVYGKMAHRLGTMNALEWEVYKQLIAWMGKNTTTQIGGFIYLKASPQTALDRVRNRKRTGEEGVGLEYQTNLARCYNEWFIEKKDIPADLAQIPVLIIDATQNFKDDPVIQQQCVDQVKAFIEHCNQQGQTLESQ